MEYKTTSAKTAHEAFISGHHGSIPTDIILAVIPVVPASIMASSFTNMWKSSFISYCTEFLLAILPLIMSFTILNEVLLEFNAVLLLLLLIRMATLGNQWDSPSSVLSNKQRKEKHVSCLTSSRATVNIATIIAILAVDFPVFPRRFAKTESTGLSLMDVGAASYLFMNGITDVKRTKFQTQSLRDILILVFLGVLRLTSTRAVNYQEHVSEYGVHGNFFFTLAAVKILYLSIFSVSNRRLRIILASFIATCHQMALTFGLQEWTLSTEVSRRESLLAANREWIVSLPGNAFIYLLGMIAGNMIFTNYRKESKLPTFVRFLPLMSFCVFFFLTYCLGIEPSRRLANVSFAFWIAGFFLLFLTVFDIVEDLFKQTTCRIFQAVNRYSLLFFLVGNLLTGLVNLSINTLQVNDTNAFIIITMYVFILCSFVYVLNARSLPKDVGS